MKGYKKHLIIVVIVIIAIGAMYGVISRKNTTEKIRIIYVSKIIGTDSDFWNSLVRGAQMAAKEYDIDLSIVAPTREDDIDRQNQLIDEAIAKKPAAILLTPTDKTLSLDAAKRIKEAGIKLVLIDSSVDENVQDSIVATDNYEAGAKLGELVKEHIKEDSQIAIVSYIKGASTAIERENGFRKSLEDDEKKIVDVVFSNSNYIHGYNETKKMLERHPDIDIIVGLNEYSAVGAARYIKDMGMNDSIKIVGFDSSNEAIKLLEEGIFEGVVVQKSFNMGYLGVENAVKILRGEVVASVTDSGSTTVKKEDIYTPENQKILFPFWE